MSIRNRFHLTKIRFMLSLVNFVCKISADFPPSCLNSSLWHDFDTHKYLAFTQFFSIENLPKVFANKSILIRTSIYLILAHVSRFDQNIQIFFQKLFYLFLLFLSEIFKVADVRVTRCFYWLKGTDLAPKSAKLSQKCHKTVYWKSHFWWSNYKSGNTV